MKKIIYYLFILIANNLFATEQQSDILHYGKEELTVDIGWGHPSPVETYYSQNNLIYPFFMISTANYRGHIATWEIEDGKFFITEINLNDKKLNPRFFKINSKDKNLSSEGKIFADWFSGILSCKKRTKKNYWKIEYSIYFHIKNGVIQRTEKVSNEDLKKIENFTEKDTSDTVLMDKYLMLYLNQNYISYYFRLNDDEEVTLNKKKGIINGKNSNSLILEYFDNDHMKWPYNWENLEMNGAPNGTWEIENNKLFLTSISLHTGLSLYEAEETKLELSNVFPNKTLIDGKVFVDWANGVYLIKRGEKTKDNLGIEEFKITEYTLLRIKDGIIIEFETIPGDFNFRDVPSDTDMKLKSLIEDYKKNKGH